MALEPNRSNVTIRGFVLLCAAAGVILCAGGCVSDSPSNRTAWQRLDPDAITLFVSPSGRDAWSGQIAQPNADATDGPLATVAKARNVVRDLKKTRALTKPITVAMRGGVYAPKKTLVLAPDDSGTDACPITYRGYPGETAILHAAILLKADHVILAGLRFEERGSIRVYGSHCQITRCTFDNVQHGYWIRVQPEGQKIEIDHCLFANKLNNRQLKKGCQLLQVMVKNQGEKHHIHHNHFRDIPRGGSGNGFETIQLITMNNPHDPPPGHSGNVVEDNLFERCNGEAEIVSVKSNGNIIRRNTFRACRGELVLRHGDDNIATGNIFLGDGEKGSGGIRLQGTDQIIAYNYFHGLGRFGIAMMDGTENKLYVRVERAQICHNTFIDCAPVLQIGKYHPALGNGTAPSQCLVANNIFYQTPTPNSESPSRQLIELVLGDQPEDWTWTGNVATGTLGVPETPGLRLANPNLHVLPSGLAIPTAATPAAQSVEPPLREINCDLLGTPLAKNGTIGAIKWSRSMAAPSPLSANDVGPNTPQ